MEQLHFTLENGRSIIVIPETQIIMDGHPILSLNYNVYNNKKTSHTHGVANVAEDIQLNKTNPNYLGYITFEHPGKMYTYTSESEKALNRNEVEETIELISHIRDNPNLWQNN